MNEEQIFIKSMNKRGCICNYCGYIYGNPEAARQCEKSRTKVHKEMRGIIELAKIAD